VFGFGLDEIDRMEHGQRAAERHGIREPGGAGARPEPISNTVRGRSSPISAGYMAKSKRSSSWRSPPVDQRGGALAGYLHVDAELGAEPRMVENARRLALGERDVASLLPAIKEQAQPQQIPMKILPLRVVLCVVAHTVFPRPDGSNCSSRATTRVNQPSKTLRRPP